MTDDEKMLKKRFSELNGRALSRNIRTFSDFLTMAEQDDLLSLRLEPAPELYGGYPKAERRLAAFGEKEPADAFPPPAAWIFIAPLSLKFAEKLTHRDYLGALMSLGVKRETMGDIVVTDAGAWLYCLNTVSEHIVRELTQVRKTPVKCEIKTPPEVLLSPEKQEREIVIQAPRADALVSAVYNLSRSEAKELFTKGLVFVNSRLLENGAKDLNEGDIVSVRGCGRFTYLGTVRETKKGKLRARVEY